MIHGQDPLISVHDPLNRVVIVRILSQRQLREGLAAIDLLKPVCATVVGGTVVVQQAPHTLRLVALRIARRMLKPGVAG